MKLYIKNMVCDRCISIIKAELDKMDVNYISVELGEVTILRKLLPEQHNQLFIAFEKLGFELIDDPKSDIIEKLKGAIVDLGNNSDAKLRTSFSDYISLSTKNKFIPMNTLLAEIKGVSIEKYIIKHKVELVKKLLLNKALNLNEIAMKMHYSNVAQLSSQFKSITGMTPLTFRRIQHTGNNNLEVN